MAEFKVNHQEDLVTDGIEMILADSSVLVEDDVLVNLDLKDREKGKIFQDNKRKVKSTQARRGNFIHSYDDNQEVLDKYNEVQHSSFQLVQPSSDPNLKLETLSKPILKSQNSDNQFAIPKKRIRIIDLAEDESPAGNQLELNLRKIAKNSKTIYNEEDERFELEFKLNTTQRTSIKSTPVTQIDEDQVSEPIELCEDMNILPKKSIIDPSLSLKHAGSTSVAFLPLPTERLENNLNLKSADMDWETHEKPLGRGLSVCLQVLREKSLLGKSKLIGRKKDGEVDSDLKHFDNKGRQLTKKQAFRMQCYSFHNQKPNLNKLQKIENEIQAELKSEKIDPALGSSSFRHIKSIMNKTKNNFVVLSKHQ